MSKAIENLQAAQKRAMAVRPEAGGFPYLAEVLRQAGVKRNLWFLPSLQSIYITDDGPVLEQGPPLVTGTFDVPAFRPGRRHFGITNGPGGQEHLPGVPLRNLASGSCPI